MRARREELSDFWPEIFSQDKQQCTQTYFMYFKRIAGQDCGKRSDKKTAIIFKSPHIKNAHTENPMCALSNPHLSFADGFGTLNKQVAGFHRAVPSTTLDKASMQFDYILHRIAKMSTIF